MTKKRVKAWAVETDLREPNTRFDSFPIYYDKVTAEEVCRFGERVVPVTIVWEEK